MCIAQLSRTAEAPVGIMQARKKLRAKSNASCPSPALYVMHVVKHKKKAETKGLIIPRKITTLRAKKISCGVKTQAVKEKMKNARIFLPAKARKKMVQPLASSRIRKKNPVAAAHGAIGGSGAVENENALATGSFPPPPFQTIVPPAPVVGRKSGLRGEKSLAYSGTVALSWEWASMPTDRWAMPTVLPIKAPLVE